ncbi:hypothetical protein LUZ61_018362 [Rhynchospora tenuis]|uniref:Protein EARLY HEADING DATE 2 n=1 Tax=Rhynchospora tenuis TaxID=198213 RepID=A0AAD5Z962_9POAL|nr:hypothetical protein LUZ61_018362 [Rhynchospora tenuis]
MMAAASSAPFFGNNGDDDRHGQMPQLSSAQLPTSVPGASTPAGGSQAAAPQKKKRNMPGNPYPDAEVIALSPRTLLATNRFVCEVCGKGFQREQNLQLHRRGHNLPWKLKQKNPKEATKRRVYLCPEPSCVHHDPSRALGDLTGIKKHYCRKHGEKKWKCEKCSKKYAVQSDWKAHSKTCGTREYRCDCGTLFSRRDSFITHRAFCDALAQESARLPPSLSSITGGVGPSGSHLYGGIGNNMNLGLSTQLPSLMQDNQQHPSADLLRLGGTGTPHFNPSPFYLGGTSSTGEFNEEQFQSKPTPHFQSHGMMHVQLPEQHQTTNAASSTSAASATNTLFNLGFFSGNTASTGNQTNAHLLFPEQSTEFMGYSNVYNNQVQNEPSLASAQMSATALLQKAAQMGATASNGTANSLLRGLGSTFSSGGTNKAPTGANAFPRGEQSENQFNDLMNSLASGTAGGVFGSRQEQEGFGGMTRDFLGVGSVMRGIGRGMGGATHGELEQRRSGGIDMAALDPR